MGYTTKFTGSIKIEPFVWTAHRTTFSKRYQPEFGAPKIDNPPHKYCDWEISEDGGWLQHNGAEKSYEQNAWLQRLITDFFAPRGYKLNGIVHCQGEKPGDSWSLTVEDNIVNGGTFPEGLTDEAREEILRAEPGTSARAFRDRFLWNLTGGMTPDEIAALGDGMASSNIDPPEGYGIPEEVRNYINAEVANLNDFAAVDFGPVLAALADNDVDTFQSAVEDLGIGSISKGVDRAWRHAAIRGAGMTVEEAYGPSGFDPLGHVPQGLSVPERFRGAEPAGEPKDADDLAGLRADELASLREYYDHTDMSDEIDKSQWSNDPALAALRARLQEPAPEPEPPQISVQELVGFFRKMADGVENAWNESEGSALEYVDSVLAHMKTAGTTGDLKPLKEFLNMDADETRPNGHSRWKTVHARVREALADNPEALAAYEASREYTQDAHEEAASGIGEAPEDDSGLREIHARIQELLGQDAPDAGEALDVMMDLAEATIDMAADKASRLVQTGINFVRDAIGSLTAEETANQDRPMYLIWSNRRMKWWGPNEQGYTHNLAEAGRYTSEEAQVILRRTGTGWDPNMETLPSASICLAP